MTKNWTLRPLFSLPIGYGLEIMIENKTRAALSKTINIAAYDKKKLAECLRILSDGVFFGTITELLVLPEYRRQGIGSTLLRLARENAPTLLYFGAQPGLEHFYEKNGCQKGLQSYVIEGGNSLKR